MAAILQLGRVVSQDPANHMVNVIFPSTQMPAIPVRVGFQGPADGVRVKHSAMPTRGSYGVVAFLGDDNRDAVWLSSIYAQQMDALTTQTDANLEYNAHMSGYYSTLDGNGNMVQSFPDGTSLIIGSFSTKPPLTRNVVNPQQVRHAIPFTDAQRAPQAPAPFTVTFTHPNGVTISISPAGLVTVSSGDGAAILTMDAAGIINLRGAQVNIGGLAETLYRLIDERFVALYNSHVHPTPSGTSDPPTVPLVVGAQTTTITFAG